MILYKGKTYENSEQEPLFETLEKDCLDTLDNNKSLKPAMVIDACDQLTQKIEAGKFDHLIQPLLSTFDIPEAHFEHYLSMFKKEALEKKVKIELGEDHKTLDPLDENNERAIRPLGILFHIAAGNLDVLPAYSLIEGLLVGNINILKLPTGDKGLSVKLLSALIEIEPRLSDYIYVFDVPSIEIDTLKIFADIADAIVVWGGNEAIKAARTMASPNTKLIEWGHKLSFAYADSSATDEDLRGLAKNIVTTNQLLCSSAQGIYVDTNDREELDRFAKRFFDILNEVSNAHQPVPYGMKSKNAVELYYEDMVKEDTGKRIFKHKSVSVITSDDSTLELSMLFRNVWVKMLPSDFIVKTLKPYKNTLQTATVLSEKQYDGYVEKLIKAGVVRIKKPEEMSEALLGESHDGMYPLRLYTKNVETYHKS